MDWKIKPPSALRGEATAPPDKSITHRAIMLAALSEGESVVENYLPSDDCLRTLNAFRALGVPFEREPARLRIAGVGLKGLRKPQGTIDAGNSGTTVRLLSGVLAGQPFSVRLTGDESLSRRPMKRIIDPLRRMGARLSARDDNYLPLDITGTDRLQPIMHDSAVASAQVKSCVLLAGIQARGTTSFHEPVKSRDHTERMLAARGVSVAVEGTVVSVRGPAALRPCDVSVPGDISSAAFFLVAGTVVPGATVALRHIGVNPTRDGVIETLRAMGGRIAATGMLDVSGEPVAHLTVEHAPLRAVTIGCEIMPRLIDEVPVLVLAATQARGTTVITGAEELRVKESDRLRTVSSELGKMGARIEEQEDGLVVHGPTALTGAVVESHGDHRIAMTMAVAGLIARGETTVRDVACVDTSFPGFFDRLTALMKK